MQSKTYSETIYFCFFRKPKTSIKIKSNRKPIWNKGDFSLNNGKFCKAARLFTMTKHNPCSEMSLC